MPAPAQRYIRVTSVGSSESADPDPFLLDCILATCERRRAPLSAMNRSEGVLRHLCYSMVMRSRTTNPPNVQTAAATKSRLPGRRLQARILKVITLIVSTPPSHFTCASLPAARKDRQLSEVQLDKMVTADPDSSPAAWSGHHQCVTTRPACGDRRCSWRAADPGEALVAARSRGNANLPIFATGIDRGPALASEFYQCRLVRTRSSFPPAYLRTVSGRPM